MVPGEKTAHSYQTVLNGANDRRTQARMSGAAPIWATATPSTFASRLQKPHLLRRPGGTLGEAAALRARSGRDNRHGRCLCRRERRDATNRGAIDLLVAKSRCVWRGCNTLVMDEDQARSFRLDSRPLALGDAAALALAPSCPVVRPERARDRRRRWLLVAEAMQAPRPCVWRIPLDSRLARLYLRNERGRLIGGGRQ